jgi:nucleoporin POM152
MNGASGIGAFPQTPVASRRGPARPRASSSSTKATSLPVAPQQGPSTTANSSPVIPLTLLDAPTQRLYAFGFYVALLAWKFYDWAQLVEEDTESFWLFLKWIAIDCAFLFGLPELRIPWLELSQPFVVVTFFFHAVFDWALMFNIGVWWASRYT